MLAQAGLVDGVMFLSVKRIILVDLSPSSATIANTIIRRLLTENDGDLLEVLTPGGRLWCDSYTTFDSLVAALDEALSR